MSNKNYQKVSYFATIPAPVRYSKDVSNFAKLLYAEITCLTNAKGYCFAMNGYLADLYKVHKNTISTSIKELETAGFIKCNYITKNKEIIERRIYLVIDTEKQNGYEIEINGIEIKSRSETYGEPINNLNDTPNKKQGGVSQKTVIPLNENSVENVCSNVTVNVNSFKEKNNSCKIEILQEKELQINELKVIDNSIISKQNDFVSQYPEVIDLLDVSMIEVFNENKYSIDEFCKSKDFELIKKEYRMIKRNMPVPKPKNRENLINWYLSLGKVQVADNLYMYPYQAIILKLVFNHKYLSKMINYYDNTYFSRDSKFKEFTDHYTNIVSWLKSDIEKNISKQGNNQFDRYYYYNWGVDRNEIM